MIYIGLLLVAAICLGGGGLLVRTAARHTAKWAAMRRWPRVNATVVAHGTDEDAGSVNPYVTVRYHFQGRSVKTHCKSPTRTGYSLEGGGRPSNSLQRWFRRYPLGSSVVAMVNPANHKEAYTHLPEVLSVVVMWGFGLLLLALALAAAVGWLLTLLGYATVV